MTKISTIALQLLGAATLAILSTASQAQTQGKLPVKPLSVGIYVIQAEFATTPAEREQGLMLRTKMGSNEGMVFDFGAPAGVCMWMKNTLIPLSVAFIDIDGRIVNIEDMQPETLDSHCAKRTVNYALEMNLGWFKQKNIKPGMKIEGLPLK
ncbi:DUF192 domain-containing protein [Undibacterium jejuense]|uniref:DUF192 domain-containing protein n=1 Tax=Undibacterium jejuense TaxID=1344949 RepID=A0A923HD65_9BURK|nr:DUF192 domain-containing protein [Undibacterium jejuense]MBC3861841.1 DUF192 domain-containing protein [Undibacterium jejuense]